MRVRFLVQILACQPETSEIVPFVKAFAGLLRRRPFLVKRLESVVCKLLTSLEFFDEEGRKKISIGAPFIKSRFKSMESR